MKRFRPGMFYGDIAQRRQVGAIALAELQPTVPEHDVETHSHDDAHFVLVLAGRYVSSAHGMPAVCASPTLIYNPPGTVHRDCFRGLEGRFFTLSMPATALGDRALPTPAIRPDALSERHAFALRTALHGDDSAVLDIETGTAVRTPIAARGKAGVRVDFHGSAAKIYSDPDSVLTPIRF